MSDVAPAVIGGIAGVAALLWLVHASAPIAPAPSTRAAAPAGGHDDDDRRPA